MYATKHCSTFLYGIWYWRIFPAFFKPVQFCDCQRYITKTAWKAGCISVYSVSVSQLLQVILFEVVLGSHTEWNGSHFLNWHVMELFLFFFLFFSFCAFGTSRYSCRHAMISLDWKRVTCLSRPCCLTCLIFIESLTLCPSYQIVQKFNGRKQGKFQFISWTFVANIASINP